MSVARIQTLGGTKLPTGADLCEDVMLQQFGTTLKEGFLEGFKILKPIEINKLPNPDKILQNSPIKKLIVGISGVSCGGKTTMANALSDWLGDKFGDVISQDDYYRPASELPINPFTKIPEFDEPESLRMDRIVEDIKKWKDKELEEGEEAKVLVVEGTMIFTELEICLMCDLRYQIHVDFQTAEYRRSLRNYKIPDPPLVVAKNIWPKYIKHRKIAKNLAKSNNYIFKQIDGTKTVEHTLMGIIEDVAVNEHR